MTSFAKLLSLIFNLLQSFQSPVYLVMSVATAFLMLFEHMTNLWNGVFQQLDTIAAPVVGAADFSGLGMVNYFFPLDTVCTYITAYAILRLGMAVVRIVKSFIPTIS